MIKDFLKKIKKTDGIHIEAYLKANKDQMALIAVGIYFILVLSGLILNIIYERRILWPQTLYSLLTMVFLLIGMRRIITEETKHYTFLILTFLLAIFRRFIFVEANFYIGYFSLVVIIINVFLILTFLFQFKRFMLFFYLGSIVCVLAYDYLYYQSLQLIGVLELRILVIFFLTATYVITRAIKKNYYRIIDYISQLTYRDRETNFYNKQQLLYDIEAAFNIEAFYLIAISFDNLDYLYRKHPYHIVDQNYRRLLHQINHQFDFDFYHLDHGLVAFILKEEKTIESMKEKLRMFFWGVKNSDSYPLNFEYQLLGTSSFYPYKSSNAFINHLYQVKFTYNRKKNYLKHRQIQWYGEGIMNKNKRLVVLEDDLTKAIEEEAFSIQIQPKILLKDKGRPSGEVLARWYHPTLGYISPYEFIPLIESKSHMERFTEQIIIMSYQFLKAYRRAYNDSVHLAINVSSSLFKDEVILKLMRSHIPKEDLKFFELEITENVILEMNDYFNSVLESLKDIGITLAIDDFGTGFSNFQYLQDLRIDTLKIDKRFIDGLNNQEHSRPIVKAMIDMGHALNMSVVAEGVEDKEQLDVLKDLSCDEIQGYYFSKPLNPKDFITYYDR